MHFKNTFDKKWFREKKGIKTVVTYHSTQGKRELIDKYIREIVATPALQGMYQMILGHLFPK